MKTFGRLVALLISLPLWLYLLHEILERVQASELMWFLYWAYIPSSIIGGLIAAVLEGEK